MHFMNKSAMLAGATAALACSTSHLAFARWDGEDPMIKEIRTEIKGFGDDVKGLKSSLDKDIADLRKLVEETKGAVGPEVKNQIEALSKSVVEKQVSLEDTLKKTNDQLDALETAFKRSPLGSGDPKEEAKQLAEALDFFNTKQSLVGNLSVHNQLTADKIDKEAYAEWEAKQFGLYLRLDKDGYGVEQKTLQVGLNPDGGYLVPTARSNRIITRVFESSPLRRLATIETIGTTELEIPVDIDEAGSGWVGEMQARAATSTPTVGVQKIPVHELYAKPRATQKFLEDAAINVEAWLADKVADRFARVEATAFMIGDGINKPRGLLTYPDGAYGTRGYIYRYPSGDAAAVTSDALVSLPFQIKSEYLNGASWLMKRSTVAAIVLLKDGNGQYMWRPGLSATAPATLLGYDVNMADDMPAIGSGAIVAAFGNWRRAYTVVDRLGITTLRDPYSSKPFVEFYTRKRVGGDVVDFDAFVVMDIAAS